MEMNDAEEFGFSRNYFLAKELGGSAAKSHSKLSDINIVDEQELRAAVANIEPKHEPEIEDLLRSYKSSYPKWAFNLRLKTPWIVFISILLRFNRMTLYLLQEKY